MSKVEQYEGRLVVHDGRLYAHGDGTGPVTDDDGNVLLREVAADPESDSYVYVEEGALSHNERHSRAIAVIQGTTEDDPHHDLPTEDDAHYSKGAPRNTRIRFDHDDAAAVATGHTAAYKGGHHD